MKRESSIEYSSGYVSVDDGTRIFYRTYGLETAKKIPLLCLSGLTRNSSDFHELASKFGEERFVIALDYRGRGHSDYSNDWKKYKIETYIFDIHHILTVLNIEKIFAVGTSLGGIVAMGMKVLMPRRIVGILLNDIGPELSYKGFRNLKAYMSKQEEFENWKGAALHLEKFFPDLGNYSSAEWERIARGSYRQRKDGIIVQNWDPMISLTLRKTNIKKSDLWSLFSALKTIPLLTLRGEYSNILSKEVFLKMANLIPSMRSETILGVGHAPTLLEPYSQKCLLEVLDEVDSAYNRRY